MKTVTIHYVRHGETLFNVTGRAQGVCDSPLTENGVKQAYLAAEKLKDRHFDKAFCSPVARARRTAEIVLSNHNLTPVNLDGLLEMNFGLLEGDNGSKELMEAWAASDYTPYGGENEAQMIDRIRKTYKEIVDKCEDGDEVLVVSHRGYYMYMLPALFNIDYRKLRAEDPKFMEHLIPNASEAIFRYEDGNWTLVQKPQ